MARSSLRGFAAASAALGLGALAALAGLAGCNRAAPPAPGATLPTQRVRTAVVRELATSRTLALPGTVQPVDQATIAAQVTGRIERADLALGQRVAAGEVLVTLRAEELVARVAQASATLDQAIRDADREAALVAQGAATSENARNAADRQRAAAAALAEAETIMGYTRIAAPFAGVITRDFVNPGDFAAAGTALFALEGTERLRVEVQVPDSLPALAPGATVPLVVAAGAPALAAQVVEVSPAADPLSRTRLVRLELPSLARPAEGEPGATAPAPPATSVVPATDAPPPAVRSGQFVRVAWPAPPAPALVVPPEAVETFGQMERVFVVDAGRARLRLVKTGAPLAVDAVEILAGLTAGEVIVVAPGALRDGQPVELAP